MEKRRSLGQYRAVDLALFALMLLIFESIILLASTRWFPGQPYTVSLAPAIVAIVLVRWGPWAALHAVLGGLVVCVQSQASPAQFAIYCVGNLFPLLLLPWLSAWRKREGIWSSSAQALGFGAAVLLLMQAGRALFTLCFGANPVLALGCFTTEVITDLFTLVILWIVRRLDGVLEDQVHYLRRVQAEEQTRF
ncbi:MAG: hypothetical protein IJ188_09625 [Clostridia bacterium]|nr:hypothetical protein [Clostridia bacterium]